jgi:hypothetical protein
MGNLYKYVRNFFLSQLMTDWWHVDCSRARYNVRRLNEETGFYNCLMLKSYCEKIELVFVDFTIVCDHVNFHV